MSGDIRSLATNLFSLEASVEETIDLGVSRERGTVPLRASRVKKAAPRKSVVVQRPACVRESAVAGSSTVIINEVAWMGSGGDAKQEWIELYNAGGSSVPLEGWELRDKSGKLDVRFEGAESLAAHAFMVLRRGTHFVGTINNSDEALYLFDGACALADEVTATPSWPAGNAAMERTAARNIDRSWGTSVRKGGTPGAANDILETPFIASSSPRAPAHEPTIALESALPASSDMSVIRVSEVMCGKKGDADYDFVELYNMSDTDVVISGVSLKRRSASGKESSLVATSRMEGKRIAAHGTLLLANEKGYVGAPMADVWWPGSYSLVSENNAVVVYAKDNVIDEAAWQKIPEGQSLVRDAWDTRSFHVSPVSTPGSVHN